MFCSVPLESGKQGGFVHVLFSWSRGRGMAVPNYSGDLQPLRVGLTKNCSGSPSIVLVITVRKSDCGCRRPFHSRKTRSPTAAPTDRPRSHHALIGPP